jgi:hypothetical protein
MSNDNKNTGMSDADALKIAKAQLKLQRDKNITLDNTISRQKDITDELAAQKKLHKETAENYRESVSLSKKISKALLESSYEGKNLEQTIKSLSKNQNLQLQIQQNINSAVKQNGLNLDEILIKRDRIREINKELTDQNLEELINLEESLTHYEDQIILMDESLDNLDKSNLLLQAQKEHHEDISEALGLSGQGISAINKLLGNSLGDISKIEKSSRERVKLLMEERNIVDSTGKVIQKGMVSKLEGFAIQVSELGKSLRANMFDPLVLIGVAFDFSKQSTQLSHSLGVSSQKANDLVHDFGIMATETGDIALNGKKLQESFAALNTSLGYGGTATMGMSADAAVLMDRWGMTGEHAANFAQSAMGAGKTIKDLKMESIASVRAVENQYGRTFALKGVIKEAATVTGEMRANFGGSVSEIAKGIATAKAFGMELKDLASSSKSLLNFESSIEAELEAELLTGKQLNLERARAAALTGDMKTLTEELNKNMGSYTDFMGMNVLQREAQAKAMGMTVGQMEEILMKDQNLAKLAQDARNMGNEDLAKQIEKKDTQQKFLDIVENLKQKFVEIAGGPLSVMVEQAADMAQSILSWLSPIISFVGYVAKAVGWILKIPLVAPIIMSIWAVSKMAGWFKMASIGWKAFGGGIKGALGGMRRLATAFKFGGIKGVGKSISRMGGGDITKNATTSTQGGESVGGGSKGASSGLKSLAKGLKSMGGSGVLKGIFNTALAGPALLLAIPAIPFISFMGLTPLKSLYKNFSALGRGLAAMSSGIVGVGVVAALGIGGALATAAIPFLAFMGLTPLKSLYKNFISLGTGLAAMSGGIVGVGVLAALGVGGALATLSIPFLSFIGSFGTGVSTGLIALGTGLTSLSGGVVGVGVITALGVGGALAAAAIPFLGFIGLFGVGVSAGLIALGTGLASLGAIAATGVPFIAVALIAALGVAMIPFAYSLKLAGEGMESFGKGIKSALEPVPPIITALAEAIVLMVDAAGNFFITLSELDWGGMLKSGPALLSMAVGVGALGTAALLASPGLWLFKQNGLPVLESVGAMGPGLKTASSAINELSNNVKNLKGVGKSLRGLAQGMGALSFAIHLMKPVMGTLRDFSKVAPGLTDAATAIEKLSNNIDGMEEIGDGFKYIADGVRELSRSLWSITPMLPVLALLGSSDMAGSSSVDSKKGKGKGAKDALIDTTEIESLLKKILDSPGMKETKIDTQPAPTDLFQHNSKMGKGVYQRENEGQVLFT